MQEIDLADNVMPKYAGVLQIQGIHEDGSVVELYASNVITYDARTIMTHLLAGYDHPNRYVQTLKVGTVSTAPARTDTDLGNVVDSVGVVYTFPNVDRVVFEGILATSSPANGQGLVEAGLFNASGFMFARQVYPVISKTNALQLKYIWTIIFT
jgi:hypothetical protein